MMESMRRALLQNMHKLFTHTLLLQLSWLWCNFNYASTLWSVKTARLCRHYFDIIAQLSRDTQRTAAWRAGDVVNTEVLQHSATTSKYTNMCCYCYICIYLLYLYCIALKRYKNLLWAPHSANTYAVAFLRSRTFTISCMTEHSIVPLSHYAHSFAHTHSLFLIYCYKVFDTCEKVLAAILTPRRSHSEQISRRLSAFLRFHYVSMTIFFLL